VPDVDQVESETLSKAFGAWPPPLERAHAQGDHRQPRRGGLGHPGEVFAPLPAKGDKRVLAGIQAVQRRIRDCADREGSGLCRH
jgi:hypothetical protein